MNYPHKIEMKIDFKDPKIARIIKEAVEPDVNVLGIERTNVKLTVEKKFLVIIIEAMDLIGLRASMNSTIRWIIVAYETSLVNIK